jgi:hypothetical protein
MLVKNMFLILKTDGMKGDAQQGIHPTIFSSASYKSLNMKAATCDGKTNILFFLHVLILT